MPEQDDPIHEYLFTPPALMHGEPHEVAQKAVVQLVGATEWIEALSYLTMRQVRNSFQTMVLNEAPATTPEELAQRWEESDRKAAIDRVTTLFAAAAKAAQTLS